MHLTEDILQDVGRASRLEWLVTNGLGGYASGTALGSHSRRYHGLLVAALRRPPRDRVVLLSHLEETVGVGSSAEELATNQYRFAVHPQGYRFLRRLSVDPFPTWTFEVGGCRLTKTVFMPHGVNRTVVIYRVVGPRAPCAVTLQVRPLIAYRDYHSVAQENSVLNGAVDVTDGLLQMRPYEGLPPLVLHHNAARVDLGSRAWYRRYEYLAELERGLEGYEDLFCAGALHYALTPDRPAYLVAGVEPLPGTSREMVERWEADERRRQRGLSRPSDGPWGAALKRAADQFVVAQADGTPTLIAGYHWFTDWSRDTMIALPGLLLATGRAATAKAIITQLVRAVDRGMLPNVFPEGDRAPAYNTVDATLWMFEAVRSYVAVTGDRAFLRSLWPLLAEIIHWHHAGTRFGIRVDPRDGLLEAGEPGVQLTWMDAKVGEWVVTPRYGKAVEVNALWHHALRCAAHFAGVTGDGRAVRSLREAAAQVRRSFAATFWNPAKACLYDAVQAGGPNDQLRPNQLLAVSLPSPLLPRHQQQAVVRCVQRHLLTPYGLRSLAPEDPAYRGVYTGGPRERDGAYHQGTVWAWLLGPFISASLRAFGRSPQHLRDMRALLTPLEAHLSEAGLGTVSELFDGDPPHTPRGCIAQAWSVGELLRVLWQEFGEIQPLRRAMAARGRARRGRLAPA